MTLQLICNSCGNIITLTPDTLGRVLNFSAKSSGEFRIDELNVEIEKYVPNDFEDEDDIETKLRSIRIDCDKCHHDYLVLEFD